VRILVLGGTEFVGRAIVDDALAVTYWVRRAARGGRVALPGRPEPPVQVIDARDLARLVVQLVTDVRPGAFHSVGPAEPVTMAEVIGICAQAAGTEVDIVPVPPRTAPGPFFPLVRSESMWSSMQRSPARALAAGMSTTPLDKAVADVLTWDRERGEPPLAFGFTAEQEAAVLAAIG
jgi:2'-hydroxyisoflavone reductase